MKLILIFGFVTFAFAIESENKRSVANDQRVCIPKYVKCRGTAPDEKARDQCIWDFVHCIKEDCDTHECDGYAKACLKQAKTHVGKHVCALGWFRCVQKMHQKICHQKKPQEVEYSHHHHHRSSTKKPSSSKKPTRTPATCGCYCQYKKCYGHARSQKEKDACAKSYATCIKRFCDTHVCDAKAKKCIKKAWTKKGKRKCGLEWFKCVKKMQHEICHKRPHDVENKHHHHLSSTKKPHSSRKPSRTPLTCGCKCRYMKCSKHAHTHEAKDKCTRSLVKCVKTYCDTKMCDVPAAKCFKKAKTHAAKHVCALGWFKCVKKNQKKICHKRKTNDVENKHHHHLSSTKKPHSSKKPSRTPLTCGCYCQYKKCNGHARSQKEKDACGKSYGACIKRFCDTHVCDAKAKKCIKKAWTKKGKRKCGFEWLTCVKKMQHEICHKRPHDNKHHHHHRSTTKRWHSSKKPTRTPTTCGCYCHYKICDGHAHSQKEKDVCTKSYATCIKKFCDTHVCDAKAKKCIKKAWTKKGKRKCGLEWFKCVKKMQHEICHKH